MLVELHYLYLAFNLPKKVGKEKRYEKHMDIDMDTDLDKI